ncbi:methyltransferase domain-containing protein [Mesorhizobium sp. L-2-11]|uniref:methyltransferase domain-containing protein n=1 Tax=Mesorhizobium sp. L-2-11 TaxID=2744521 RepID=UPI001925FCF6|nr:methyltransferase domain-containing protein [Mesorhizobium sp. L-2-11]BCH17775.1 hypothetical protein MesoLjLa_46260 [Mesorhizobium sp. L-2-11]
MSSSALQEHLGYVGDSVRLEQFKSAVAQVVKHGDYITDLGCGTGILGLLCLQAGASRVYAIDATAMIEVARESLVRAGWGDQAIFMGDYSARANLPERVDVVICDQVGYFGFDAGVIEYLADARRRFLKPGGALIPARLRLQLAAVESETSYGLADGWRREGVASEFHWVGQYAVNNKYAVNLQREELLGAPAELGSIDLREDNPDFFSWDAELRMERDGVLRGLGGWFDCELAKGVWLTNSPLADRPIKRSQAFLPIGEAVEVKCGDVVKARVMARPTDSVIAWEVEIPSGGLKFSHSTWQGELRTPAEIMRRNPAHVPRPNSRGQARMIVLGLCDGQRTVRQVEEAVLREHPGLFPSVEETARFVAQVLGKDTE